MQLTRRQFGCRSLLAVGTVALATIVPLNITGCSVNVKALLNTVLEAAQGILNVAEANAPWLSSFTNAVTALEAAISQWTAGGVITVVEQALNALESVLAVIPVTEVYSPLIAVLVAGIDAVLNAIAPSTSTALRSSNPYRGMVTLQKPHFLQTQQGAVKEQWNNEAKRLGLPKAEIR